MSEPSSSPAAALQPSAPATGAAEPAIKVVGLRHAFKSHQALGGVTFSVPARSIHGFVGPNGAGKTTTLKVLATLLKPDSGDAWVFGENVCDEPQRVRRSIGFMPDHFSMYRQMTVIEYLDFFARAYGLGLGARDKTITDVLAAFTDMAGRRNDFIKGLSRGMQQRVSVARVLINDPDLLLLDEPASGLDPRARIELMEILRELQRMGKTVFISSHILSELGDLCDSVTIMDRGAVRFSGPISRAAARGRRPGRGLMGHRARRAQRSGGHRARGAARRGACHRGRRASGAQHGGGAPEPDRHRAAARLRARPRRRGAPIPRAGQAPQPGVHGSHPGRGALMMGPFTALLTRTMRL